MNAVVKFQSFGLRLMTHSDLPVVMEIESSAYEYPWSEGIFRDCMRVGYACWIYEKNEMIKAYGVMSIVAGECHILNLCVKPQEQGRGLGRLVLRGLLNIACQYSVDTAVLEVRPSNCRAVMLYLSEGFNEVGQRKNYYPAKSGREDALIFAKSMGMLHAAY